MGFFKKEEEEEEEKGEGEEEDGSLDRLAFLKR